MVRRILLVSGLALAACVSQAERGDSEPTGLASLAIAIVPANVSCIQISAANSARSVTDSFNVTSGQSTVLPLTGLPTGKATFNGVAFAAACKNVTASSTPDWIGGPLAATISSTSSTPLTLNLVPNGQSSLTVNFEGDGGGAATDGNPCNAVVCTASDSCHVAGTCDPASGTCSNPLAPGANCQAGQTCAEWFPDCDGDGFGAKNVAPVFSCSSPIGSPACAAGFSGVFVANTTDCCDVDVNAHPGQTAYFTTPDACGATTQAATPFDYNCDATDEQQSNGPTDCLNGGCVVSGTTCVVSPALPADCNGMQLDDNLAACGAIWDVDVFDCSFIGPPAGPECVGVGNGGPGGTQACH
jgi:hypothetical protein